MNSCSFVAKFLSLKCHMKIERRMPRDDEFQMPSFRLDGRVALVTGGGRGLGLAMAQALAEAGADVAIASRTQSELEVAADLIRKSGSEVLTVPTDVSDVEAVVLPQICVSATDMPLANAFQTDWFVDEKGGSAPDCPADTPAGRGGHAP